MKKILLFLFLGWIISSCKEVGPYINLHPAKVDTSLLNITYVITHSDSFENPDPHILLVEDFTGMNCVFCPLAAVAVHNLDSLYPGKIIPIAYHLIDNITGDPQHYLHGRSDFPTNKRTNIFAMLSSDSNIPNVGLDRIQYSGESYILFHYGNLQSYYINRMSNSGIPPVNIHLSDTVKNDSVKVRVTLYYTSADQINNKNYLSVSIIEDSIMDWQAFQGGIVDTYYYHNHILRTMLTDYNGTQLNPSLNFLVRNRVFIKEFKIKLDPKWNRSNCSIIAYVNRRETSNYEVLQTARIKMIK